MYIQPSIEMCRYIRVVHCEITMVNQGRTQPGTGPTRTRDAPTHISWGRRLTPHPGGPYYKNNAVHKYITCKVCAFGET